MISSAKVRQAANAVGFLLLAAIFSSEGIADPWPSPARMRK